MPKPKRIEPGDLPPKAARMLSHVYEEQRDAGASKEVAASSAWCTVERHYTRGKGGRWRKRAKPLPAVGDAPCPSPSQAKRTRAKKSGRPSSSTSQNEKSKRTRAANPRAPALGELGTCTEIGRVHELQVELPSGEVQSHAWRGRHPLLMWSPTKRALVFAYGGKLGRPKRGDVPRDDGAAATSERFEGKRADYWRDNLVPKVSLRELGRARIIAYRGPKWRGRVAEHKLGPSARAWMGRAGTRKVYVVAGGNLRLTGAGIEG